MSDGMRDATGDPECPGPRCPMCSGECCNLCGAGCWNNEPERPRCDHDVLERHADPMFGTEMECR